MNARTPFRRIAEAVAARKTARDIAGIPTERIEHLRDHAAARGLEASREHYDALLADRVRRESRARGAFVMNRAVITLAAVACWLAIFAGIALIAIDPGDGWIGVTVIMAALVTGSAVLACLRRGKRNGDAS